MKNSFVLLIVGLGLCACTISSVLSQPPAADATTETRRRGGGTPSDTNEVQIVPDLDIVIMKVNESDVATGETLKTIRHKAISIDSYISELLSEFKSVKRSGKSLDEHQLAQLERVIDLTNEQISQSEKEQESVTKLLHELLDRIKVKQEKRINDISKLSENGGLPAPDLASANELMKNCLVELQRVEWDITAELALEREHPDPLRIRILQTKIEQLQVIVGLSEAELNRVTQDYNEALQLVQKKVESTSELRKAAGVVASETARLRSAKFDLETARLQLESESTANHVESARRLVGLKARKDAVLAQLKQLQNQRAILESVRFSEQEQLDEIQRVGKLRQRLDDLQLQESRLKIRVESLKELNPPPAPERTSAEK